MVIQLALQGTLDDHLGQLAQQAALARQLQPAGAGTLSQLSQQLRACPGFAVDEVLRALRVPVPDITGTVIPLLVHELAAFQAPVVLVLDDYQLIKEPTCHEQIAFLMLHLPPSAQLALVTRTDPPLPLARLRAAGEMVEIRTPELRLELSEAAELIHNVSGLELAEPDLAILLERTEGWPAGLYLAALSLRSHPSPSAFIRQFTGDNRFIVDFLAEEVLSRQPSHIRRFLARTAVLDRFCAPLCDAVIGSANAAEVIDVLESENLFLVPLDDNRQWYRYHHLFAQVLRGQLARTEPGIGPALYERASAWHQEYGSTDEAIGYALAAGDVAWAVDLIASHWFGYVDSGRVATVRGWLRSLGDNQIAAMHWQRTAQRGWPPSPTSRGPCGAGFRSSWQESMTGLFLTACGRWTCPPHFSAALLDSTASGRCKNQRPGLSS